MMKTKKGLALLILAWLSLIIWVVTGERDTIQIIFLIALVIITTFNIKDIMSHLKNET